MVSTSFSDRSSPSPQQMVALITMMHITIDSNQGDVYQGIGRW